jgi:hypothetical protein
MTIPWPQEVIWPAGLHEHATRLIGYIQNALLHIQCEDQPVPTDQVRKMMMATMSLIAKAQRTSDMTSVHNKINIIHTEVTQNADGTAEELATIKEELKSLTISMQEGITAGREATVAAKEAAEIGKIVAGMTRDIKNKGTQHQAGVPASYAAAAARGALAASTYSTQSVEYLLLQFSVRLS